MFKKRTIKRFKSKVLTFLFYGSIGTVSFLGLFLFFYWSLRLNASIDNLIRNFYSVPFYFWPYVILTVGTLILFGINVSLLAYRWRKYGLPKLNKQVGGGLGTIIGVFASACPVCGSTLLSAVGIVGGLAAFPLGGLELKALSFGLMTLPVILTGRELRRFRQGGESCPIPKDYSYKSKDKPFLIALSVLILVLLAIAWNMLKTDPIVYGNI